MHVSSFWLKQSHRSRNISHFPHFPISVNAAFSWKVAIKVSNSKLVLIPGPPVWHIFFCGWRGCLTCSDPPGWWWGSCGGSYSCWGTHEWRERTPVAPQSALWRELRWPVCEAPKTGRPPRTPDRWPGRVAPAVGACIVLRASQTCRLNSWAAARAERRGPAPCTARTACRRCIYRTGTWCTEEVEWSEIGWVQIKAHLQVQRNDFTLFNNIKLQLWKPLTQASTWAVKHVWKGFKTWESYCLWSVNTTNQYTDIRGRTHEMTSSIPAGAWLPATVESQWF